MSMLEHALTWWQLGYVPLPAAPDGTKRPAGRWKQWQHTRPTEQQLDELFAADHDGLGVLCGAASGGLEMLELEARAVQAGLFEQLTDAFADHNLADLWATITAGYLEATPTGGLHAYYHVEGAAKPNTRLARTPHRDVLIETRGEGGWTIVAPSAGRTHPNGRAWTVLAGSPANIPTITADQRDTIHTICSLLDQAPDDNPPTPPPTQGHRPHTPGEGLRPGDHYNETVSWDELLIPDGWTKAHKTGGAQTWGRPGKNLRDGISATTGRRQGDQDCLYVFSSSVDLPTEQPITKLGYLALTRHAGDYSAAARALAKQGYGDPQPLERPLTIVRNPPGNSTGTTPPTDGSTALQDDPRPQPATIVTSLTDKGNADLVVAQHAHRLHYVPARKQWITWDGHRWQVADDHAPAIQAAQQAILAIDRRDQAAAKHQDKSLSRRALEAAAALAATHPDMRIGADQLDANPNILNTPGGIIDLTTGHTRPTRPDDWCTRTTTCPADPDQPTPRWQAFLKQTFTGHPEIIGYIQRLAGYSAGGQVTHHILPFLHGGGSNGKSVFLDVLTTILGDYATTAPAAFLMAGGNDESAIARLAGQRLVICSEIDQRARFDEAKIKLLTGGDRLTSRFLYGQYFTFRPTHHLWLMGNHQPRVEAGGQSFWRRLRLIPFANTVPEPERIEGLAQQLVDQEGPGILAWIIQGAIDNHAGGLQDPETVLAATREYELEEDALGQFAAERLHIGGGADATESKATLYEAYRTWCRTNNEDPISHKALTRELRSRWNIGDAPVNRVRRYTNVTLLADETEPDTQDEWWQR